MATSTKKTGRNSEANGDNGRGRVQQENASSSSAQRAASSGESRSQQESRRFSGGSPLKRVPTREEIAARAYELFEKRGVGDGNPEQDWLQAERELRGE